MKTVNVNFATFTVNSEDITISVATDPQGNVYTLTIGRGVVKRNAEGVIINSSFIPATRLDAPLDMAIDEEGYIYIADYYAGGETYEDNGKIKVFSPQGTFLPNRTILTSFYRPLGLDVDKENVYVAEFNDGNSGPERNKLSRVEVINKINKTLVASTNQVDTPLRIAVDSEKNIYVSQAGSSPGVLLFNPGLVYQTRLNNIRSPGSVVIDDFDFIHVIEYDGRIDFGKFINFESLTFSQVQAIVKNIDDGQRADAFSIKIFDKNRILKSTLKNQIDFPVDLTFNDCDRMYVNNAEIFGRNTFFGYLPEKMEFELEIYQRSPSFDTEKPVLSCSEDVTVTAASGQNTAVVTYSAPSVSDNCSTITPVRTKGLASGSSFTVGEHVIEFTATDAAGNTSTCSFTITVNPAEEDLNITCPQVQTENLGANCLFTVPDYKPRAQVNKEGATITQDPPAGSVISTSTPIVLTATLGEETDTCTFQLIVRDVTKPIITCPGTQSETYNSSTGFTLPDYRTQAAASDNCTVQAVSQSPAPGTVINQNTLVTLRATDPSGNFHECSFTVELLEEVVLDITCPQDQTENLGANCLFTVPDYKPRAQVNKEGATITQDPPAGSVISTSTPVVLTAKLGEETDTCTFQLIVRDVTKPIITCPGMQSETYNSSTGFTLPDYRTQATASDNCTVQAVSQSPAPGTVVNENTLVTLRATDPSGNFHECSFTVELSEEVVLDITCPQDQTENLGANCLFTVPDYKPRAQVNKEGATITQDPPAGSVISTSTPVVLTAKLGEETDTCTFQLIVRDVTKPVITCPGTQSETYNPSNGFTLPDYRTQAAASDNCTVQAVRQSPAPGTVVNENTLVTLRATDPSGNFHECSFTVELSEEVVLDITCPQDVTLALDENCMVTVPDFTSQAVANKTGASFAQSPAEGTVITENTAVTITATLGDETDSCNFLLLVADETLPGITCPGNQSESYDPETGFTLPDYTLDATASDNCGVQGISQSPAPGTVVFGNTPITLTVTDTSGLTSECNFTVELSEEIVLDITCPEDVTLALGENCMVTVPDYTSQVDANKTGVSFTQSPAEGTVVSENTAITITATLGDETDSCNFQLIVKDSTLPEITCPGNQTETYNPETGFILPDYTSRATAMDNCRVAGVSQSPAPGTLISENTLITLTASDNSGNVKSCEFTVELSEEIVLDITCPEDVTLALGENCMVTVPDYTSQVDANKAGVSFTQSPAEGTVVSENTAITITATLGEETDTCNFLLSVVDNTKPIVVCTAPGKEFMLVNGFVTLSPSDIDGGSTDNCSSVSLSLSQETFTTPGTKSVTLYAQDTSGNTAECTTTINIFDPAPSTVDCKPLRLFLSEEGAATLNPADIYDGDPGAANIAGLKADRTNFSCNDLGDQTVKLTVTYTDGSSAECYSRVTIVDEIAPQFTNNCEGVDYTAGFEITAGFTVPDFYDNFAPFDNCTTTLNSVQEPAAGTIIYEEGTYPVVITVTDESGNFNTCSIDMIITAMDSFDLICNREIRLPANDNCEFILPDLAEEYNYFPASAVITQSLPTGELLEEDTEVVITATYNGQVQTCSIRVKLVDYILPEITCLPSQNVSFTPSQGFVLPNYVEQVQATDNCEVVSVTQNPPPGTIIRQDEIVTITAEDNFGNLKDCFVYVYLVDEEGDSAPVAIDNTYNTPENTTLTIDAPGVLGNDSDPEGDPLTAILRQDVSNGTLNLNAGGSFTYTPNNGFVGTDHFTYVANDGEENSNIATVTIEVIPVTPANDPPVANNDSYTTSENTTLTINAPGVLGNDTDPEDDPLTTILRQDVSNGTLDFNADGSFTYTPNNGFVGTDHFTYVANDGETDSNIATVTIEVIAANPVNSPPVAEEDNYSVPWDQILEISLSNGVLSNDVDPDGDSITAILLEDVANGTLAFNRDGSFTYTPNSGFTGVDFFTYYATDGENDSDPVNVYIDVVGVSGDPVARSDEYIVYNTEILEVSSAEGVLSNDSDPEGDDLTAVLTNDVTNGTLILYDDGSFTYTPDAEFVGNDFFSYYATDGENNSNTVSVTIRVLAEDGATLPVGVEDRYSTMENTTLIINDPGVLQNDQGSEALRAILGDIPSHGDLTMSHLGGFTYIPNEGYTGTDFFTYGPYENNLAGNSVTVFIEVIAKSDFSCVEEVTVELDGNGMASITAADLFSGNPGDNEFSISKTNFTCADVGPNTVTLSYQGSTGSGACEIVVNVEDNRAPQVRTKNISVSLGGQRQVIITPQMVNDGSTDNCKEVTLSLDRTTFSCTDIGNNVVTLTAIDRNGNSSSTTAIVTITGFCGEPEPDEYTFIYPNPTKGPFTIVTPTGVTLKRIQVYDARGRFIVAKNYPEDAVNYTMDLSGVQEAVYMLKLYTSEGNIVLRVIID